MWCGSTDKCRNPNTPADGKTLCTSCLEAIHSECIDAGEDDVEYICVGCNTKPNQTMVKYSTETDNSNTVITLDDAPIITGRSTNTAETSEYMDVAEDIVGGGPTTDKTPETITEGDQNHPPKNGKKKKPPVAPGAKRITKQLNNQIKMRPNRSTQSGEFLISRLELRVNITQTTTNETNIQKLRRHLVDIAAKLTESDNHLKLIPWREQQAYAEITAQNVPNHQPGINKFFNRASPRSEGFVYADIRIKHKRPVDDIIKDISLWLSNQQHGIYFQTLQCEETTNIGWLLWSFRKIDIRKLEDEIWALYNINIALKYQKIALSTQRGSYGNNNPDTVKALHIWTQKSAADRATKLFNFDVYKDTAVHFPLGIVLRFIPHISQLNTDKKRGFHRLAWELQQTFLNGIENSRFLTATSWEIAALDQKTDSSESLRKLVMGVESKRRLGEHLFLSVDYSFFRQNEVLFSFLPRHEQEAREFVTNLVPYILNTHPEEAVKSYFHADAVDRALNSFWDNDNKEVISLFDKYMEDFEIMDNYAEDFLDEPQTITTDGTAIVQAIPEGEMSKIERIITGADTDSIGTLLTNNTSQYLSQGNKSPSIVGEGTFGNNNTSTSLSTMGQSTTTTMSQAQIEANVIYLNKSMSTIESIVLLIAQSMKLDIKSTGIQVDSLLDKATASTQEDGCNDK